MFNNGKFSGWDIEEKHNPSGRVNMKALFLIAFLALLSPSSGDSKDLINPNEAKVIHNNAGDTLECDPDQLTIVKKETKTVTFTFR